MRGDGASEYIHEDWPPQDERVVGDDDDDDFPLQVSNVSIIFDCSMLLYYLFWMFMGFIKHFYTIFGTNLLTQSPVPVSVFFLVLGFRRKGKSNGVQLT